jgi:hypothetical protein
VASVGAKDDNQRMAELTGYSFSPGLQRRFTNTLNGQSVLSPGQSQALQVLALRLPGFLGGAAPAPDMLLRKPLGGLRPDVAVRAQVTGLLPSAPSEQPQDRPSMPAAAAAAAQPSNPAAVSSFGGSANYRAPQSFLNPFSAISDPGQSAPSGAPSDPAFTFNRRPGYGEGDANIPPPTLGPRPGQDVYQPPSALNDLMSSLFGGGAASGDSNRGSRFV